MAKAPSQKTTAEVRPFGASNKPSNQIKSAVRTFGKNIASLASKAPSKAFGRDSKEESKLASG